MIRVFEAVSKESGTAGCKIFLAGGITDCPDWQRDLIAKIRGADIKADLDIYNPRRANFPIGDPNASTEQIKWEFDKLKEADLILFWFSSGSLNPIVLYELGMWGNSRSTPIIVGVDDQYVRKRDVIIQTNLARPNIPILCTLDGLVDGIRRFVRDRTC